MKKTITAAAMAAAMLQGTAGVAQAGGPTCENMFGLGWANHGEHVLGYGPSVGGVAGGAPGLHKSDFPS